MFELNMWEESKGCTVIEQDTNPEAVDAMLSYIYGRDLTYVEEDPMVAVDLLRLANKYKFDGLQKSCEKILQTRPEKDFDVSTALHMFLCGYQLCLPEIEELAARLVISQVLCHLSCS